MAPLWALLVGTGLRLGEGLGLRWSDVDLPSAVLTVNVALRPQPRALRSGRRLVLVEPKTPSSRRTVALAGFVVEALLLQRDRQADQPRSFENLVFTSPKGTPLDARNVSRAFTSDLSSANLPTIRIHDLRHTAASLMLGAGFTLEDVKRMIGHASIALTSDTYGHLVAGRSRELADGMERLLGGTAL